MRIELYVILAIGIAVVLVESLRFIGYERLIQPLGVAFLVLAISDWIRVIIKQIRKAGGWKQWREQQEKENREAISV